MTIEERQKLLNGYKSIHEKAKAEYGDCINDVVEFIKNNNKLPNEQSENEEEKKLAKRYLYGLNSINQEQKEKLKNICKKQQIQINVWEKILFEERINKNDLNQLIEISQKYVENTEEIPEYLTKAIEQVIRGYDIKENKILFELLDKSEKIKQENLEKTQKVRYELLNKINSYLQIHIDDSPEKLKESGIIDLIRKLRPRDYRYIQLKYENLKGEKYKSILESIGEDSLSTFCRKMRYLEEEQFDTYLGLIKQSEEINEFTIKLMEFIFSNNGRFPSIQSADEEEKLLAEKFLMYSNDEKQKARFDLLEVDKNNELYNPQNVIYKLAMERKEQGEIKTIILNSIRFLQEHGRKPLINSEDIDERTLAAKYQNKCIGQLGNNDIAILNRLFNNKKNFQKTCDAFIRNIKKQEGFEPDD